MVHRVERINIYFSVWSKDKGFMTKVGLEYDRFLRDLITHSESEKVSNKGRWTRIYRFPNTYSSLRTQILCDAYLYPIGIIVLNITNIHQHHCVMSVISSIDGHQSFPIL